MVKNRIGRIIAETIVITVFVSIAVRIDGDVLIQAMRIFLRSFIVFVC